MQHNRQATAESEALDKIRIEKGLKRPVKPKLVNVPRPIGPATAQRIHATLRAALNAAVRAEEISRNVAAQAEKPTVRRKKPKPWQPKQLGYWLDSIGTQRLYPLFHLGAFAGMRRGELLGLRWEDVDFERGCVTTVFQITNVAYAKARRAIKAGQKPVYLTRTKTEEGEENVIDLDPATMDELAKWKKVQDAEREQWGGGLRQP